MTATALTGAPDPTAVVGRRFGAVAIDIGILWVFTAVYWVLASKEDTTRSLGFDSSSTFSSYNACTGRSFCTNVNDRYVAGGPLVVLMVIWFVYMVGVFVLQRGLTGRTVGTMLTGVVVVNPQGRPLGVGKALLRSVAGVVDYLPCCLPIVGFVTVLATPQHRRVGDMAADSYVVGNEWFGRRVELPGPPVPFTVTAPPPGGYPAQPPIPPGAQPPVAPAAPPAPAAPYRSPFAVPGTAPGPGPGEGAVWDPQRRAYLQWDEARQQWLQYDQAAQEWQQYDAAAGRWRAVDR